MVLPDGLTLGAYLTRHNPFDAFVSNQFASLDDLPIGAKVGTSSLRRECQLRAYRPDLSIVSLRGNVGTRLSKLDNGEYDAIILASSGLERLKLNDRIRHHLSSDICLPAVGQGTLGIECRADDKAVLELFTPLNHEPSALRAIAERAMNRALQGGCQVPIAGFATLEGEYLWLEGRVGSVDGQTLLKSRQCTVLTAQAFDDANRLGLAVANELLAQGADKILQSIYHQ